MSYPVVEEATPAVIAPPAEGVSDENQDAELNATSEKVEEQTEKRDGDLPKGVKRRFKVLTERNKAYEEQLAASQRQIEELRRLVETITTKPKAKEDFANESEYMRHLAQEEAKRLYSEQFEKPRQMHEKAQKAQQAALAEWQEKVAEQFSDVSEFSKVVSSAEVDLGEEQLNSIMESDLGPKIAYYLAQNPDEAERLVGKSGRALDRAIVRLEIKVEQDAPQQTTRQTNQPTKAPKPIGRPSAEPLSSKPVSIDDWVAQRRKQIYGR